ncbi:hypothetical protein AURDEDRAFT_172375 [Auricularia subglabra TFB-10046 SS5]|nr:hypothetical protein AURDEDRAFT_172375 [Auricularia subglabra TFB-10046 SS5]
MDPKRFLSPVDPDDDRPIDADLINLPGPCFKVSYTTDVQVSEALSVPDEKYDMLKSGWERHLKVLHERDELRYTNFSLKQMVTGLRNDVKRANAHYKALEEEYERVQTDIIAARRDAHVYLVELYKVTGSVTLFKDDDANRRALESAQEWLHREAARVIKADMASRGCTDFTTFHALVHLPASPHTPLQSNVTSPP